MRIDLLVMSIGIFSLVFVVGIMAIADVNQNYGGIIDSTDFNRESYDKLTELSQMSNESRQVLQGGDAENLDQDSLLKKSWNALGKSLKSFSIIAPILEDVALTLHIPTIFITAALTILSLMLVFGIAYLVWGVFIR